MTLPIYYDVYAAQLDSVCRSSFEKRIMYDSSNPPVNRLPL